MTREQFIALVKSEQEALRGFLLALCCGKRDDADDIAQETLVKAYLSSSAYRDKGKFRAWLFTIARNTFLNHKASKRTFDDISAARSVASATSADSAFRHQELYMALATLSPKEPLCSGDVLHERLLGEGDSRHHRLHHRRREEATLARQRQP